MKELKFQAFIQDHMDEIIAKIEDLDNFGDADISILKTQIARAINIRKHMPVVPIDEIRELMVGYMAIKFKEDELGFKF